MAETDLGFDNSVTGSPATESTPVAASLPPATGEAPKKSTLRDQLKENFKKASEAEIKPEKTEKPTELKGEKPRDETGKFVKSVEAPKEAAPAESKQEAQPIVPKADGPPPGWSSESKQLYASLPDPIKQDILKREKEVSDGFKKYSDDAKRYQEIDQVLSPSRPSYQQHGLNDAQAINRLIEWERTIRSNPQMGIVNLARQFGIDLASLAQTPGQSNGQDVLQYLQPVQQQLGSVQQELNRMQAERAASEIAQFSKDKPYFDRVKVSMGKLMAAGVATDLDSAYQMATWQDSSIRDEMQAKALEEKLASERQEQQQRALAAKKAAVSPSTRAPAAPIVNGKDKPKGVRGSILQAIETIREERA